MIILLAFFMGAYGVMGLAFGLHPAMITISWIMVLIGHMAYSTIPERYIQLIEKMTAEDVTT